VLHGVCDELASENQSLRAVRIFKMEISGSETIVEAPVLLTVNGTVWDHVHGTPVHLEALAIGFLYNEGVIKNG